MDIADFDQDIAEHISGGLVKRNEGLAEVGKAALTQIRRLAGRAIEAPRLVAFHGMKEGERGRWLDGVEILSETGKTYVETMDEQGELWRLMLSCWDLVAVLLEVQLGTQATFTVELEDGMVYTGVDSMSLHDPAAFVTLDGQLVRN